MKTSVYLGKPEVTSFDELVRDKYLYGEDRYEELEPVEELPFNGRVLIKSEAESRPNWREFVKNNFQSEEYNLINYNNSLLIQVDHNGRQFCFCFGYAWHAVDKSKTENRFGLLVTLNALEDDMLTDVKIRKIAEIVEDRWSNLSRTSDISDFEVDPNTDMIKYAGGKIEEDDWASNISGSESLRINLNLDIDKFAIHCGKMLELFESDSYQDNFPHLDYIKPLEEDPDIIERLEEKLLNELEYQNTSKLSMACPDFLDRRKLNRFKLMRGRGSQSSGSELTRQLLFRFLDEVGDYEEAIFKGNVVPLDENDDPILRKYNLIDYLVYECDLDDSRYVLAEGSWYDIDSDYEEDLKEIIRRSEDIDILELPTINEGETEGDYLTRISDDLNDCLILDKDLLYNVGSPTDKIEACDILTHDLNLICVKRMTSSASLSHLFAQGSVSARLIRIHEEYCAELLAMIQEEWPQITKEQLLNQYEVTYALPTDKEGPLHEEMFFFSMVNFKTHRDEIMSTGSSVNLTKVEFS